MPVVAPLLVLAFVGFVYPPVADARGSAENAEARLYFEEGNRLYREASRAHEGEREKLLQQSLQAYVDSLQIVRSRNAVFNAAIVLGELGRYEESFNYLSEYLQIEGLSDEDRADATRRRNVLREQVAVVRVVTEPAGALVWVDRKDLGPRGETPLELAIREGKHRLFVEREGFLSAQALVEAVRGEVATVTLTLQRELVSVVEPAAPRPVSEDPPRRLRNAAIGTGASLVATLGVAIGVSVKARSLRNDYDQAADAYRISGDPNDLQRAQGLADRTERFNLTADVLWGTTIALGVSAIVLYGVHRKRQKRTTPQVSVAVSRHGGYAAVAMQLGARR